MCALSAAIQEPLLALGDPPHLPPFPFPRPKPVTHTVYDLIHGNERYTKLNKAIKFVGDDFISVLNNTDDKITFFAVPDSALRPHHDDDEGHKHKHKHHSENENGFDLALAASTSGDGSLFLGRSVGLSEAVELIEYIEANPRPTSNDDDEPSHEKRKEIFRQIVKAILNYHIFGGHEQRIMVTEHLEKVEADKKKKKKKKDKMKEELVTRINLYAKIDEADTKTENGYVHVVNHPLLPPPAIFQEVFLAQHFFSTFTSTLQRVGLTDELDIRYVKGEGEEHGHLEGSTAVTLKLFLFSAFGRRVLRKLLEYHIVPNVVAHADIIFNQTAGTPGPAVTSKANRWSLFRLPTLESTEPISSIKAAFNTRLFNHTIDFSAENTEASEFKNQVFVNGHPVAMADFVALNGAVHAVDHLLCPCKQHAHAAEERHDGADEWEDWETCVAQLSGSD
ncbi:fasciclin domain family protein [Coprinopsis sp. MPI-PUGE-AT-0042]|nr:fasciclin domain family protein [Coprinopsis sp. MPI-PUGE-AT-0042]